MSGQVLREYQEAARQALREGVRRGVRNQLLVAPTGSGKTTIAAALIDGAVKKGGRVLFLAHRKELIDQCSERLDGAGIDHGIIMAKHPRELPDAAVQIASVQTLAKRAQLPSATLVIVDEAHHARAGSYGKILAWYDSPVIGLSATPWRLDGRGLGEMFQEVVVAATPRELIEQGHLVPYTGFAFDHPDLKGIEKRGNDYEPHALELAVSGAKLAGNIVEQYQQHAAGSRAVVFAVSIAHSRDLVGRFQAAGVTAEHVDGEMPTKERAAILARLKSGATQVVCNVNVLTEGWDYPELETCILARPTLSVALYLQMVGRALRPAPGKPRARIHDHAGNIEAHGLPDADRDYSLEGDRNAPKKKGPPALRTCPECFAIYDPALSRGCPACLKEPEAVAEPKDPPKELVVGVRAVALEEIRGQLKLPLAARESYLEAQLRLAREKGYKPGWAAQRYKAKFGEWPARRLG